MTDAPEHTGRRAADCLEDALDDIAVLAEDLAPACRIALTELLDPALGYLEMRARLCARYAGVPAVRLAPLKELADAVAAAPGWTPPDGAGPEQMLNAWHLSAARFFIGMPYDPPVRCHIREELLDLLAEPYRSGRPAEIAPVVRHLEAAASEAYPGDVAQEFRDELSLLAGYGVIELKDGSFGLTPAGTWLVRERLRAVGVAAPVVYGSGSAQELLLCLATYSGQDAAAEIDRWRVGRSPAQAAGEIVAAMKAGSPADWRAGLRGLDYLGADGVLAVRSLGEVKGLRGMAHRWLLGRGLSSDIETGADDVYWSSLESICAILDLHHSADVLWDLPVGPEDVAGMAATGHPRADEALKAISEGHGRPEVRAAAADARPDQGKSS